MTSPRRLVAIGLAALVGMGLLAGCGGHSAAPAPNDFDQPTTTTTDPYAVPAVIDAAYVERVLNALEDVRADVRRDVVANHRFTQESRDKLAEIAVDGSLTVELHVMNDASMKPAPSDLRIPPGSARHSDARVRTATPECVEVITTVDNSAVITDPSSPAPQDVTVLRHTTEHGRWNRTPWKKAVDLIGSDVPAGQGC